MGNGEWKRSKPLASMVKRSPSGSFLSPPSQREGGLNPLSLRERSESHEQRGRGERVEWGMENGEWGMGNGEWGMGNEA